MNTSNKLFLSTATVWNAAQTMIPFKWFSEKIDTQTSLDDLAGQALEEYRIHKEDNVAFVIKLMKQADINITDVTVILAFPVIHGENNRSGFFVSD